MLKSLIEDDKKVEHVKNERRILIEGNSTFLLGLNYAFQDPQYIYLVTEYCPGGDLDRLLRMIVQLTEEEAKMYMAEMIMGVHTLHQLGYIHRDLKPENFLIDSKGHLKLADFGLSKAEQLDTISLNYDLTEEQRLKLESIKGDQKHENEVSQINDLAQNKLNSYISSDKKNWRNLPHLEALIINLSHTTKRNSWHTLLSEVLTI